MFGRRIVDFKILKLFKCSTFVYSKTANNRTPGSNNEYTGNPGGPGTGFCNPGGGFLVLVDVVACHYVYYH